MFLFLYNSLIIYCIKVCRPHSMYTVYCIQYTAYCILYTILLYFITLKHYFTEADRIKKEPLCDSFFKPSNHFSTFLYESNNLSIIYSSELSDELSELSIIHVINDYFFIYYRYIIPIG